MVRLYSVGYNGAATKLAQAKTDATGAYTLNYKLPAAGANIKVRVVDAQGKETTVSSIAYNAAEGDESGRPDTSTAADVRIPAVVGRRSGDYRRERHPESRSCERGCEPARLNAAPPNHRLGCSIARTCSLGCTAGNHGRLGRTCFTRCSGVVSRPTRTSLH